MDGAPCVPPAADSDSVSDAHRAAVDDQTLVRERQEGEQALKPIDGQKTTRWREQLSSFFLSVVVVAPRRPRTGAPAVAQPEWPFAYSKYSGQAFERKGRSNSNKQDMRHSCSTKVGNACLPRRTAPHDCD